jgi:pSer/pThr/pTyr-binding forkhead associated (FHA) protein
MTKSFKLILQSGPNAGTEFLLEKDELFLGRDVNNDITINDPEVSRRHARISRQGEDYVYEDLGSTNGSFILGQRVNSPTLLQSGTAITIGERILLKFVVEGQDVAATVAIQRQRVAPAQSDPVMPPSPVASAQAVSAPPAYTPPANNPPMYASQDAPVFGPPPIVAAPVAPKKKTSKGVVIILIVLAIIIVFCVVPWVIVEVTNSYCSLFPGLFNAIQAGACP